jgi:hypothetical protein
LQHHLRNEHRIRIAPSAPGKVSAVLRVPSEERRFQAGAAYSGSFGVDEAVNSAAAETRPSLSWDGTRLYFGSTRSGGEAEGDADHYVTTRDALNGSDG